MRSTRAPRGAQRARTPASGPERRLAPAVVVAACRRGGTGQLARVRPALARGERRAPVGVRRRVVAAVRVLDLGLARLHFLPVLELDLTLGLLVRRIVVDLRLLARSRVLHVLLAVL